MAYTADHPRPSKKMIAEFAKSPTATVVESGGICMPVAIKPIYKGMKVCGSAFTVDSRPGDNLALHYAVAHKVPGDVLVCDMKGFEEGGPFGELMATQAMAQGFKGLVIDACVRDGIDLNKMKFPVFARGLCPKGTTKVTPGKINVPITCAGVPVGPGDIIVADDDGVVVVPLASAEAVLEKCRARDKKEVKVRDGLAKGDLSIDRIDPGLKLLKELGYL
jgi:4-hydroxy-4-methyl-2-oxoglutarate aldolase